MLKRTLSLILLSIKVLGLQVCTTLDLISLLQWKCGLTKNTNYNFSDVPIIHLLLLLLLSSSSLKFFFIRKNTFGLRNQIIYQMCDPGEASLLSFNFYTVEASNNMPDCFRNSRSEFKPEHHKNTVFD